MALRRVELVFDELDYDAIQNEIALRQKGNTIPDGESDVMAAVLADCIRDLEEYRVLCDAANIPPFEDSDFYIRAEKKIRRHNRNRFGWFRWRYYASFLLREVTR